MLLVMLGATWACANDRVRWRDSGEAAASSVVENCFSGNRCLWAGMCNGSGIVVVHSGGQHGWAIYTAFMRQDEAEPVGEATAPYNSRVVELRGEADPKCAIAESNLNAARVECRMRIPQGECYDGSGLPELRFNGERRWENAIWECP